MYAEAQFVSGDCETPDGPLGDDSYILAKIFQALERLELNLAKEDVLVGWRRRVCISSDGYDEVGYVSGCCTDLKLRSRPLVMGMNRAGLVRSCWLAYMCEGGRRLVGNRTTTATTRTSGGQFARSCHLDRHNAKNPFP